MSVNVGQLQGVSAHAVTVLGKPLKYCKSECRFIHLLFSCSVAWDKTMIPWQAQASSWATATSFCKIPQSPMRKSKRGFIAVTIPKQRAVLCFWPRISGRGERSGSERYWGWCPSYAQFLCWFAHRPAN